MPHFSCLGSFARNLEIPSTNFETNPKLKSRFKCNIFNCLLRLWGFRDLDLFRVSIFEFRVYRQGCVWVSNFSCDPVRLEFSPVPWPPRRARENPCRFALQRVWAGPHVLRCRSSEARSQPRGAPPDPCL